MSVFSKDNPQNAMFGDFSAFHLFKKLSRLQYQLYRAKIMIVCDPFFLSINLSNSLLDCYV